MDVDLQGEVLKEVPFSYDLVEGSNKIEVKAKSVDGTETVATEEVTNTVEAEDNIEITLEKYEDIADKVKLVIKTSSEIAQATIAINGEEFNLNGTEGLTETPPFDLDLGDGTTTFKVTVVTTSGNTKTIEKEFTKG